MKNAVLKTGLPIVIALTILFSAVSAQDLSVAARVNIPFQFLAGNTVLPAGSYLVKTNSSFRKVELFSKDASTTLYLLTPPLWRSEPPLVNGKLVFRRYGDVYALREVWEPGQTRGYQLPKSSTERELARANAPVEVASATLPAR